jgi:hypothetical protein
MTTIGQLPLENSVSALLILQNDETLEPARAQILSGRQHANTVPQDALTTSGGQPLTNSAGAALTTN